MPYVSDKQRRFFHSPGAKKAGISSATVSEFDRASKGKKLSKKKKSIPQMYQDATKGLQNYGTNIAKNVAQGQANRATTRGTSSNYGAINPFPNPLKSSSYKKTHKKTKLKIGVDNKMKGSYGETDIQKGKKPIIRINVKKHNGNKEELADTIRHEMYHAKHPKATEKKTYAAMPKKISEAEQNRLIAKLRTKKSNYKVGAIKRKLGITRHQKTQPGDFIKRMNEMKITKPKKSIGKTNKVSMMGLV
jgi:hypothetical protein